VVVSLGPEAWAVDVPGWTEEAASEIVLPYSDYTRKLTAFVRAHPK